MKILVFIDQFSIGGGARVVSRLLDGFVNSGNEVSLATKCLANHTMYPIPQSVTMIAFNDYQAKVRIRKLSSFITHLYRMKDVRRIIGTVQPDVIVAEMAEVYFWVYFGSWGIDIPIIAHDHTSFSRKLKPLYNYIRHHLYGKADSLVILTERDNRLLGSKFPNKVVIGNPLPFEPIDIVRIRRNSILCVGRFDVWEIKGFDIIIDIFSNLIRLFPEWRLEFAGTGPEESMKFIKKMVEDKGLHEKVIFHGQISNIQELYQQVKIFALPSRMEGMPMGLMEAMSQGCACVAFEVGGATNEMITQGISGFCVEDGDINAFSEKLKLLMSDEDNIHFISDNAIKASQRFTLDKVMKKWNELLISVHNGKN